MISIPSNVSWFGQTSFGCGWVWLESLQEWVELGNRVLDKVPSIAGNVWSAFFQSVQVWPELIWVCGFDWNSSGSG